MRLINWVILFSLIVWLPFHANSQDIERIVTDIGKSPYYERAKQLTERIEDELDRRVKQKIEEKREIVNSLNQQILVQAVESETTENDDHDALFDAQSRIFIFLSRSVPISVLKSYAADIDKVGNENIRLVFKAFPRNFLNSFLVKDPDCTDDDCVVKAKIIIGESLYKRYAVDRVPAVVFDPDPTNSKDDWLLVYGAVPLKQALLMFHRKSGRSDLKLAANRVGQN
jgi:hypothetical protein